MTPPPDAWDSNVTAFVLEQLPEPGARVLEVGCGDGRLALAMADAGYRVRAIDPEAPEGPIFERVTLEDLRDGGSFDAAVAVLSLHHVADVAAGLRKIRSLMRPDGVLVTVEFGWDRFDRSTMSWCRSHLDGLGPDEENWLRGFCWEWSESGARADDASTHDHLRASAERKGLHPSGVLLRELHGNFRESHFEWSPYLWPDLDGVDERDERRAIEMGTIRAVGFRFAGTAR